MMVVANIYSVPKVKDELVGDIASQLVRDLIAWADSGYLIKHYSSFCTALEVNKIGNAIAIKHVVCYGEQPSPITMPLALVEAIVVPLADEITVSAILNNGTKLNFKVYDYDALMVCRGVLCIIGNGPIDVNTMDLIHYISDYNYEVEVNEGHIQSIIDLSKDGKLRYAIVINDAFVTKVVYNVDNSALTKQAIGIEQLDAKVVKELLIPIARLRVAEDEESISGDLRGCPLTVG